ncbi:hypothetical protein [Sulfurovum sp.]|uniref:hypothetical protein n=1 Tax=Sulfurovum sp. TaxID=1969726 RepID=UPI0025F81066|nr:hypothetical protein [Sulfurovum sp.]
MKASTFTTAVLLAIAISGCGASDGKSSVENAAVSKEDVCTLLTTAEVSQLVGEKVHDGKRDTKHVYPNTAVCTWTSVSHDMPLLLLTYNVHTSSHKLDYYAPPLDMGYTIKELNGSPNEAIAVLTSKKSLFEVIVRSGENTVLLTAPFLEEKEGSKLWNSEIQLAKLAAKRAKGK